MLPTLAVVALVLPSCTRDFSDFEANAGSPSSGGRTVGDGGDGSVSSGGAAGSGGAIDGGGVSATSGGASGGGGSSGATGGRTSGTGGTSGAGGTGGVPDAGATGGTAGGGGAGGSTATGGANNGTGGLADAGTSCGALFGAVPGYLICTETTTSCRFVYSSNNRRTTCATLCPNYGGACLSEDNANAGSCTVTGTATCTTQHGAAICVCSKR